MHRALIARARPGRPGQLAPVRAAAEYNQGKGSIYMVMEFCEHDLTGLTDSGVKFNVPQIKCFMKQLLQGLDYCHKNRILHRDIKGAPAARPPRSRPRLCPSRARRPARR